MDLWIIALGIGIIVGLVLYFLARNRDGFDAERATKDVIQHSELFNNHTPLKQLREKMSWLDPVYYYDISKALKTGGDVGLLLKNSL